VKLTHDGLSLWYGTPDAPAPLQEVVPRTGALVTVGVHPPNPTNAVHVRYRVDGGLTQIAPGRELFTDGARAAQYFGVKFPPLPTGNVVEYCPVLSCAGRQVPAPGATNAFPSKFELVAKAVPPAPAQARDAPGRQRAPLGLELTYLATVILEVNPPLFIGETPEGVRIDFCARAGTVSGPALRGKVVAGSSDHMFVRPDGVGAIRARWILTADDGSMFEVENLGSVEFGEEGYQRAREEALPLRPTFVLSSRFLTGSTKYLWLNRVHCIGAGKARLDELLIEYDLFVPRPRTAAVTA
jgi:Protein of unknown function (DUF3237)